MSRRSQSRRGHPSVVAALGVGVGLALALAGCGGDDASTSTTTTPTTIVVTTTTIDPDATPDHAFCQAFDFYGSALNDAPQNTLEQMQAKVMLMTAATASLVEVAPDELTAPAMTVFEAAAELEDALAPATTMEEAQAALAPFVANEDQAAASAELQAWVEDNCGQ